MDREDVIQEETCNRNSYMQWLVFTGAWNLMMKPLQLLFSREVMDKQKWRSIIRLKTCLFQTWLWRESRWKVTDCLSLFVSRDKRKFLSLKRQAFLSDKEEKGSYIDFLQVWWQNRRQPKSQAREEQFDSSFWYSCWNLSLSLSHSSLLSSSVFSFVDWLSFSLMKNENESVENILFVSCLLLLLPPLLSFRDDVLYFYLETGCNKSPVTSVGNSFPLHTCFPHSLSPFECLMCSLSFGFLLRKKRGFLQLTLFLPWRVTLMTKTCMKKSVSWCEIGRQSSYQWYNTYILDVPTNGYSTSS